MRFKDIQDGYLHVVQRKTGNPLKISLDVRLEAIGMSIGDMVAVCRDRVVSPYLIHHTKRRTTSELGDPVHKDTISRGFARARSLVGIGGEHPPTFHEIRSLSARLYQAESRDPQLLLGHRDPKTTLLYKDGRGYEWMVVEATPNP